MAKKKSPRKTKAKRSKPKASKTKSVGKRGKTAKKKVRKTARAKVRKPAAKKKTPSKAKRKKTATAKRPSARPKASGTRPARAKLSPSPSKASGVSRTPARPIPAVIPVKEEPVGTVTHYFSNIMVAVIELNKGSLNLGDKIRVKGHTTDFSQNIQSIEIEHQPVMRVNPGQSFGVRVIEPVREHDAVYRVPS